MLLLDLLQALACRLEPGVLRVELLRGEAHGAVVAAAGPGLDVVGAAAVPRVRCVKGGAGARFTRQGTL
jgi:hypothetical protein